jgi:8-oxo-dGTP pyrophosphatase MutT (NUDIX family)
MAVDLAAAVAVLQEGKVLLIQRMDAAMWGLPSSKVERSESIAQAAIREVQIEVGPIVK